MWGTRDGSPGAAGGTDGTPADSCRGGQWRDRVGVGLAEQSAEAVMELWALLAYECAFEFGSGVEPILLFSRGLGVEPKVVF